jgi:hypothetical protein
MSVRAVGRRSAVSRPRTRSAWLTAKLGAGLLRVLGGGPQSPRFVWLVEDRATDLKRVRPPSVAFVVLDPIPVVLDPIPNDLEVPTACAPECPVRNERRGRSLLARGRKLLRLGGDAHPTNRHHSCTRWCLGNGCNPEPRFSGLWVTPVAWGPSDVIRSIVFRAPP